MLSLKEVEKINFKQEIQDFIVKNQSNEVFYLNLL